MIRTRLADRFKLKHEASSIEDSVKFRDFQKFVWKDESESPAGHGICGRDGRPSSILTIEKLFPKHVDVERRVDTSAAAEL